MEQLDAQTEEFRAGVERFIDGLISHYVLDGGRLVVAHAGLIERYHGRASGRVREFCLYGQTTGETDEYGLPVRYPWATEYRGRAVVVYGHTPVPAAEWLNNTLCVDTGCVFGGRLTALQYPERSLVSVPATRVYHPPAKPFPSVSAPLAARREPDVLDIGDVSGSRVDRDGVPAPGRDPRRARRGRAGGDEPVRDRPALAALPPADHEPRRHAARRRPARAPRPGLLAPTAPRAWPRWCARRSTWARAPCCWCAGRRRTRPPASACPLRPGPRRRLDQDRPAVLPASADGFAAGPAPRGGRGGRAVRRARHVLAAPGRRTGPLERQGRLAAQGPVRGRRRGRPGLAPGRGLGPGAGGCPRPARRRRAAGPDQVAAGQRGRVHRRLPALLLGHRRAGRGARRPVPAARHRGRGLPRPAAPVAPRPGRPAGRRRTRR